MANGHGGKRAGAGRKPGSRTRQTAEERRLYAKHVAAQARSAWRAARARGENTPPPPRDNYDAAVGFIVKLAIRAALKGSNDTIRHLDERLSGRVKYELEHAGPGGDAIPVAGRIVYSVERDDGSPPPAATPPLPGAGGVQPGNGGGNG